jgi:hypothetical protein
MIIKLKWLGYLLTMTIVLVGSIYMLNNACAQGPEQSLDWSIKTTQNAFYPGEPVLLTLNIRSMGTQEEKVNFGADGIEAFSMEIHNSNGITVAKGGKIQRFGLTMNSPLLAIHPNKTSQKSIVLNQWCSTLLLPGKYHIICNVEYRLRSESRKKEGSEIFKAGPFHKIQLELDVSIIEMDKPKLKKILETLTGFEVKPEAQSKGEWLAQLDIAREMLTFTESELAVPYQLQLLKDERYAWRKRDIISSLVRSRTLEATVGLMQIIEEPTVYKDDIKQDVINAVYILRETGNGDIVNATEAFVAKYKRPALAKPVD